MEVRHEPLSGEDPPGDRRLQGCGSGAFDGGRRGWLHRLGAACGPVAPQSPDPVYATRESGFRYETYEEAMTAVKSDAQEILDEQVRRVEGAG
jgi:hypothetical protein